MKKNKPKVIISSQEIKSFYHEQLRGLRKMVSLSRKGKPRKQAWGMHIEKP
jgi:hypothetical protein